jgi:hypothetical protein
LWTGGESSRKDFAFFRLRKSGSASRPFHGLGAHTLRSSAAPEKTPRETPWSLPFGVSDTQAEKCPPLWPISVIQSDNLRPRFFFVPSLVGRFTSDGIVTRPRQFADFSKISPAGGIGEKTAAEG